MRFDNFIGGSYEAAAATADMEDTWNLYPELLQSPGATAQAVLYPTPGVRVLQSAGAEAYGTKPSPGRAHLVIRGREFAVIGNNFFEIDSFGKRYQKNTDALAFDSNPATLSTNGDAGGQILVTSGGHAYIFDMDTAVFSEVTALAGKATMGDYLEGYFLVLDTSTSTLLISNLLDGLTWDTGEDFAQRSLQADRWLSMKVVGRYIWLFGEFTSECWYNTGSAFPFAPHPSGAIHWGIAGPWTVGLMGTDVLWLGTTKNGRKCVLRAAGFTPEVVTTYPVETALQSYDQVSDAIADVYSERGHLFYLLYLDRQDVTWAWDSETKIWCKRGMWLADENRFLSWRPRYYAYAFNQHRMLDGAGHRIYELSSDITTDVDGAQIRRLRRAPAPYAENLRVFYGSLEVDLEPGLATADATNPQVMLRLSNNGGKTWISEQWRSAGKIGEYDRRVRWNRLGSARRRVFEVSMTDAVPWKITGAFLEANVEGARG